MSAGHRKPTIEPSGRKDPAHRPSGASVKISDTAPGRRRQRPPSAEPGQLRNYSDRGRGAGLPWLLPFSCGDWPTEGVTQSRASVGDTADIQRPEKALAQPTGGRRSARRNHCRVLAGVSSAPRSPPAATSGRTTAQAGRTSFLTLCLEPPFCPLSSQVAGLNTIMPQTRAGCKLLPHWLERIKAVTQA